MAARHMDTRPPAPAVVLGWGALSLAPVTVVGRTLREAPAGLGLLMLVLADTDVTAAVAVGVLMLAPLLMLASACAHKSPPSPPPAVVPPPAIPALPHQARQPTPPPICLPTCSAGLTRLRMELLDMLTKPGPQGALVSEVTTH